ncbi:uncharacterized protein BP5553_03370 [Venustampulla echinocandica]|uniref:Uncharacterized protein n=1 Tax=Venustampulla echinocandica TaxID=2656787 RepID=A0A370TU46_9HELO|nr:uncharacterized protein BP5553_03370 [Venustampulla echinocandica]RDL39030.1 hypothetical protein BP5553_03370 [Venustampulla echinocandica]
MTSLVSEFLINPVLRTARRFSRSNSNNVYDNATPPAFERTPPEARHEDAVEDIAELLEGLEGLGSQGNDEVPSITGEPVILDSIENDESIDAQLHTLMAARAPNALPTHSPTPIGPYFRRLSSNEVDDDDVTHNPSFGIPSRFRTNSSTTNPLSNPDPNVADTRASPIGGRSRTSTHDSIQSSSAGNYRNRSLPADDGMGALRQRIIMIQAMAIPAEEKARMMHSLLIQGYTEAQMFHTKQQPPASSPASMVSQERPTTPGSLTSFLWQMNGVMDDAPPTQQHTFHLSPDDLKPSYAPLDPPEIDGDGDAALGEPIPELGCQHYKRNVKLQCTTCDRWYTCRMCHDETEDHVLNRKATKNMLCMLCGYAQRTCGVCMSMSVEHSHKCIERVSDCDCPICEEYMFTSPHPVVFMLCGHSIHKSCYEAHMKTSYKCPICSKSTVNMETQFRNLDRAIDSQPMPPQFQDTTAMVSCNDCYAKSAVKYHWLGLKCAICDSYNTAQLSILSDLAVEVPAGENRDFDDALTATSLNRVTSSTGVLGIGRRHSSHIQAPMTPSRGANRFPAYSVPQRIARSVSPVRGRGIYDAPPVMMHPETDDSAEEDELDFWGRDKPRSLTSGENIDEMEEDDESEEDSVNESCDEDDEDEEDQFELIGHR